MGLSARKGVLPFQLDFSFLHLLLFEQIFGYSFVLPPVHSVCSSYELPPPPHPARNSPYMETCLARMKL